MTAATNIDNVTVLGADCVNYVPLYVDIDGTCRIFVSGNNIVTPGGFIGLSSQAI